MFLRPSIKITQNLLSPFSIDSHRPHPNNQIPEEGTQIPSWVYRGDITCVCIMGGDASKSEVEALAHYIKNTLELKVAWYSGRYDKPLNISDFDYIKFGPYLTGKGGLKSPDTNQKFYKVVDGDLKEMTYRFQRR